MDQSQRIHLLITFFILMKEQELLVDSSPVRNSPPPFNVAEDVYVTQMYNVSVCVIDGTPYDDGEFIPTIDPCESCICHPPGFACKMIKCKKVPTGCIQKAKRLDDCCPRVICDDAPTHNLVYRIGNENDTIVWSTEEPPVKLAEEQDTPLEADENTADDLLVAESNNITTKNQTTSNAPMQTTLEAESTSKVPSTTVEIATSSDVPLSTQKIATSSEFFTSTIQIASTDLSNVSKDSLITKQLSEPTTMVVNYSIQLIVDTATFSPNVLQDDVDDVRNPQVPINISLPLPAKGSNDLLRKPIENDLKVPLPTTLSVDIEVNKPEANNGTNTLAESSTQEDSEDGGPTITQAGPLITEEILPPQLNTSEEQNSTSVAAETYSYSATPSTNSTEEDSIADASNSTLEKVVAEENPIKNISENNSSDIQSTRNDTLPETTENSIKTTHLSPAIARSVDSDENKFGQPEVTSDVTLLPSDEIQNSDEPKDDFDSKSNSSVSPPKTDQINSQNYNSFIPSGPIIFPSDQNFINEHGMRPRDVETTTIEKKETESEPNQQTTEKLADSIKEVTSEKNIPEISPSEKNAEESLTQNKTNEDQILQDSTILSVQSSEPSEESTTEELNPSTKRLRDISTTSHSPEENPQPLEETNDSYPESSVELENICPHYKRKSIPATSEESKTSSNQESQQTEKTSEESTTSSKQESQQTEKTTNEDPQRVQEISTESELPLEVSSKSPVESPATTVQTEFEAPRGLLDQSEEAPIVVQNVTQDQMPTSTEQPKQVTESSSVASEVKLATTGQTSVSNASTASEPKAEQEVAESVVPAEQDEPQNITISFSSTQSTSTVTIPEETTENPQTHNENFSIYGTHPSIRKLETTQNEKEINESATEKSTINNEDNETTPKETITNTIDSVIKIEIIPSEVRSLSERTSTEKQLEASTEAIATNSQVTTEEAILKTDAEPEKPVSESTTLETEKSLPETEKPLPESEKPLPETEKPLPETEKSLPETEKPLSETEKPLPETEKPLPETEKPLPETEKPLPETEKPLPETEKPLPETEKSLPETEKNLPETEQDEKPLPEPTELVKENENTEASSGNDQAQTLENSPEFQTQTPLSTAGSSEAESVVMVTHSQTDQETSKKDSPNTDFQQSTTETMTSSPWTVVMETIFSSVVPSSYDPLNEN